MGQRVHRKNRQQPSKDRHIQHSPRHCRTPQEPHLRACRCPKGGSPVDTGRPLSHEQFAAWMRGDTTNLPVILFDPLDTEKENNND